MPFWSSLARVRKIIKTVPAYANFRPVEVSWEAFRDIWLSELAAEGLLVGVNWSGSRAVGYDVSPEDLRRAGNALVDARSDPQGAQDAKERH